MTIRTTFLTSAALAFAMPAFAADSELTVLDWAGWDIAGVLTEYVAKNGDQPTYSFFADDDEAFQKASSGFKPDVAHPCAASVSRYRDADLLEPWDTTKIPEFANLAPRMLNSPIFKDDAGVWFIPTDYAYTAVAYNTKEVPAEDVASLKVFTDPKYAGRLSMPDSTDDVWSLAFLATGVTSWENVTDEQFTAAADWLRAVHPNVRAYWADPAEMSQLMATGEVLVAWSWNDGVALLQQEGFPIGFQRAPAEGAATWFCGYVNFKDAPGKEDKAYDFINSLLAHSSAPALLEALGYAHANDAAMKEMPVDTLAASFVDPVTTTLFAQTPVSQEFRTRMIEEFEAIKAGF
ncbi:extracellular solute-binding protein [Gemmobacter fulvus]|uniref:Extracellular solute-binding protein n=1 Tax=Gemmobacter fulvus TaxID=2840474 RepID=A0A975S249_9RHOB|nr:extracellular solute-binding protein [Gemmobacter fulvus]MBT9244090.1 extracellular solute-binding protein [Gemmobacter fulvus]MDQ1849302.1 extracellular solute-binding protein [Gemmobacter fulvus]QWK90996.1 extracellular solute-binding protein [Gemmobacter fulvus]